MPIGACPTVDLLFLVLHAIACVSLFFFFATSFRFFLVSSFLSQCNKGLLLLARERRQKEKGETHTYVYITKANQLTGISLSHSLNKAGE
ncbi:Uncharacterized protein APZ42_014724 [Daphnia magna]|uniref:Uncharacterized protein n=1 Tax=Daphnia magna TaxID=35525 RepID=A0A162PMR5_9CRUS|nr:Uncharacterized protein APZ42_014724 [Daphnia magna]